VRSEPGRGTEIVITVPLSARYVRSNPDAAGERARVNGGGADGTWMEGGL